MKSEQSFLDLSKVPFSRKGSYLSILNKQDGEDIDRGKIDELYLSRTWNNSCAIKRADLIKISLVYNGKEIPYRYTATPSILRLDSEFGYVEFCITDENTFRFRGEGVTLRYRAEMWGHEGSVDRQDGTWEISFSMVGKFLFVPLNAKMNAEGGLNWMYQTPNPVQIEFFPQNTDNVGERVYEGAIHHYFSNGQKEMYYEDFDKIVEKNQKDFEAWGEKYPAVRTEFQKAREKAIYIIWSHVMAPNRQMTEEMVYMSRNCLADAFGWQQSYQAIAVGMDIRQAWGFLCNMFAYQLPDGQLPDWINDACSTYLTCKPPFQGLAFDWLWNHADMTQLRAEDYKRLYEPLAKWTLWWFDYRDSDRDGIPQYSHPDESGWDDGSIFSKGVPVESPDLCAFLILQTEALGKMAGKLGRHFEEKIWMEKSKCLLRNMLKEFWDGEHFVAKLSGSHEIVGGRCVALYQPIILGKRLPADVLEKLIRDLSDENGYLCEHGIASEHPNSSLFEIQNGFCRGVVVSPVQLMMVLGIKESGEDDLAKEIAYRFCRKVARDGFSLCHFPWDDPELVVAPSEKARNFVSDMSLDTSWTAAIFLTLAGFVIGL